MLSLAASAAVVAGTVTVLVPGGAQAAQAAQAAQPVHAAPSQVPLPIGDSSELIVDPVHGHLFFAGGGDGVLVTDLSGRTVTTLGGEQGAAGLALSPDGHTVYAALSFSSAISAIDTATLTETARYPVAGGLQPVEIAATQGHVWFSYAGAHPSDAMGLGYVDLTASTPKAQLSRNHDRWNAAPLLATSPGAPTTVVAADRDGGISMNDAARVTAYDVSSGDLVGGPTIDVGQLSDLAISPDGQQLVLASSEPVVGPQQLNHRTFLLPGLTEIAGYPDHAGSLPDSVAISPNGTVAAGDVFPPDTGASVSVYAQGDNMPVNGFLYPENSAVDHRGLAWGPGGAELFVVTKDRYTAHPVLNIYPDSPELAPTGARLAVPGQPVTGTAFQVLGALDSNHRFSGGPVPVAITRTSPTDPHPVPLPNAMADPRIARFSFTDTVTAPGTYTYQASFAGDALHTPASATVTVQVLPGQTPPAAALGITTDAQTYAYGATARITAHLGTTASNRTVSLYAQPAGGARSLIATGPVDPHGNLAASYRLAHSTTLTAVFTGDTATGPANASVSVGDHAGVNESLRGYYADYWSGHTLYRVYHRSAAPALTVTVLPSKAGQCVVFDLQRYYSGAWHESSRTGCVRLSATSAATDQLARRLPAGAKYRIAATYRHSGGDQSNLDTTGSWLYFTIRA